MQNETPQHELPRTEVARSLEDRKVLRALEQLTKLGLLISVSEVPCYHGRVAQQTESGWKVDPHFDNGGNNTGNHNVHNRPALYASDQETALAFAEQRRMTCIMRDVLEELRNRVRQYSPEQKERWLQRMNDEQRAKHEKPREQVLIHADGTHTTTYYPREGSPLVFTLDNLDSDGIIGDEARRLYKTGSPAVTQLRRDAAERYRAETYRLHTADPDARFINMHFKPAGLNHQDQVLYQQSLEQLRISPSQGSPYEFHDRKKGVEIEKMIQSTYQIVLETDVPAIAQATQANRELVRKVAGAFNARQIAFSRPTYLMNALLQFPGNTCITSFQVNGQEKVIPLNLEYVARYMREAHIVGIEHKADSATLNKTIVVRGFLDLSRTKTDIQLKAEQTELTESLKSITELFQQIREPGAENEQPKLLEMLEQPYVRPETIMSQAQRYPLLAYAYSQNAGNWEGFLLGEHTETVLRNFEENFANSVPVGLLPFMRLAIVVHDLGKPQAVVENRKSDQDMYNRVAAEFALNGLHITKSIKRLLISTITDGVTWAFQHQRRPYNEKLRGAFKSHAHDVLKECFKLSHVSEDQCEAYMQVCMMLQTCDGGAYTNMAVTRQADGSYFKNYPSFNTSFESFANSFDTRRIQYAIRKAMSP